jgi:hypothetical protein
MMSFPDGGRVACHLHTHGPKLGGDPVSSFEIPTPENKARKETADGAH